jgi:hypothetical protein
MGKQVKFGPARLPGILAADLNHAKLFPQKLEPNYDHPAIGTSS